MKKGLVVLHEDFGAHWTSLCQRFGVRTLGLHANPLQISIEHFLSFVEKERGTIVKLEEAGISVEYELHALEYLLPRSLFQTDRTLFRVNEKGKRVADYNGCPSSKETLRIVEERAFTLAKTLRQASSRYHLWTDDDMGGDVRCHCEKCRQKSAVEQNLLFYQAILRGLRRYNPKAELSFLLYGEEGYEGELPEGLFVEYAPFKRRHDLPITAEENAFFRERAATLVERYGKERTEILEYFLSFDYLGFCKEAGRVKEDVAYYRTLGVERLSTFLVCADKNYLREKEFCGVEKYMQL